MDRKEKELRYTTLPEPVTPVGKKENKRNGLLNQLRNKPRLFSAGWQRQASHLAHN